MSRNNRANGGSGASANSDGLVEGGGLYLFETTASLDDVAIEANAIAGASPQGAGVVVLHAVLACHAIPDDPIVGRRRIQPSPRTALPKVAASIRTVIPSPSVRPK